MTTRRKASAKPGKPTAAQRAAYEAKINAALAWPSFPEPPPLDEAAGDALLTARKTETADGAALAVVWTYNAYGREVLKGCFSATHHSTRSHTRTTSQTRGGPWFLTRKDAAEALAWAIARECARTLLETTRYIEQLRSDAEPTE